MKNATLEKFAVCHGTWYGNISYQSVQSPCRNGKHAEFHVNMKVNQGLRNRKSVEQVCSCQHRWRVGAPFKHVQTSRSQLIALTMKKQYRIGARLQ